MTCPVPGCCGGVALAGGNSSCLQAGGSLGSTLLTPPGGSFPTRKGFAHVLVPTGTLPVEQSSLGLGLVSSGHLASQAPLPPALCPQLRAAQALPRFAPLCHGLGTPGVSWNHQRVAWFPVSGSRSSVAPCPVSWKSLVHAFSCFLSWTDESLSCLSSGWKWKCWSLCDTV